MSSGLVEPDDRHTSLSPPVLTVRMSAQRSMARTRFSKPILAQLDSGKVLGIRAGVEPHRFLGVWMVVVGGRLFVRSWNDKPTGWHRVFATDARGAIQIGT